MRPVRQRGVREHCVLVGLCVVAAACAAAGAKSGSPAPTALLSPESERNVQIAALQSTRFFLNLPTPFCIVLERGTGTRDPDPELLRALPSEPLNLPGSRCPRTYGSMVVTVDSAGRPADPATPSGYIDPYLISVSPAVPIVRNLVAVRIAASQGTLIWVLYCEAVPTPPVHASCGVTMKGYS